MASVNTMDGILVDFVLPGETKARSVLLKEFLELKPEQLTAQNQKIQKALGRLYQLNDRKPPLFHSFPKRNVGPLIINCTPVVANCSAHYVLEKNKVEIVESALESTELFLIDTFAHELKHAEQSSEEFCDLFNAIIKKGDGLAYHQLKYLKEAQAYAFGSYVSHLAALNYPYPKQPQWRYDEAVSPILEEYLKDKSIAAFSDIEHEIIKRVLPIIYSRGSYRDEFDLDVPISKEDTGLTEGEIPTSFHFKQPRETLFLLQQMPREARTLEGKELQFRKNHHELLKVIYHGPTESLKSLVEGNLQSGKVSPGELLETIEKVFTLPPEIVPKEHIQNSKDILNFFLDMKVNEEKPLMQKDFILKLLRGSQYSLRKDVARTIRGYLKEHPEDKRFTENRGLPRTASKGDCQKVFAKMIHRGIHNNSTKSLILFFNDNLEKISPCERLEMIAIAFTRPSKDASKCIQSSKNMLNFFLDLKVGAQYLMQESFILKLLKDTRSLGREDVEKAILDYQKEHPDDKRFFKIEKTYSKSAPKTLRKVVENLFAKMPKAEFKAKIAEAKER